MSYQKWVGVGNVCADPEMRYTPSGIAVTRFRFAVTNFVKDGEKNVTFIPVTAWRRLAEVCGEYLKKGTMVLVEGHLEIKKYETGEGQERWSSEIVASTMKILSKKDNGGARNETTGNSNDGASNGSDESFDDIPF